MAEKVTYMALKVDLQCSKCYRKVKKVLCKFPQIQDQVYDEKNNTVKIKVVCCSPEKIRDKICCKGGGSIESIEILKPPQPPKPADKPKEKPAEKPKEKPAEAPKPAEKPKEKPAEAPKPAEKPKEKPAEAPKPAEKPKEKPAEAPKPAEKPKEKPADAPKPADKPKEKPAEPPKQGLPPPPTATPAPGYPPPLGPVPVGFCCTDCYGGHGGGPCYGQPLRYYDGYYGRPVCDSWGGGGGYRGYNGKSCGECFSDENPQGCTIM